MVLGVTGGFCCGKSLVTKIFKSHGAKIINLDSLSHRYLKLDTPIAKRIIRYFGKNIVRAGRIDRRILASKVFGNQKRLKRLNSIIHPAVISDMQKLLEKYRARYRLIVVEAPLLFEARLKQYFDLVIVVKTNRDIQFYRAKRKFGLSDHQIENRISSQLPLSRKVKEADFVIDNSGSISETKKQIESIIKQLKIGGKGGRKDG